MHLQNLYMSRSTGTRSTFIRERKTWNTRTQYFTDITRTISNISTWTTPNIPYDVNPGPILPKTGTFYPYSSVERFFLESLFSCPGFVWAIFLNGHINQASIQKTGALINLKCFDSLTAALIIVGIWESVCVRVDDVLTKRAYPLSVARAICSPLCA